MIRQRRPVVLREGEAVTIETPRGAVSVTAWLPTGWTDGTVTEPGLVTVEAPNLKRERGPRGAWRLP